MKPESLFGLLSDPTRLRTLMLIQAEDEVCVCELTFTLDESQPKISRHLALMREAGIVEPRREGTWMHYRINPLLPDWAKEVIRHLFDQLSGLSPYINDRKQLTRMKNRPERNCV
jgi:ArsR family transcriptional regulator